MRTLLERVSVGRGFELEVPKVYQDMQAKAEEVINERLRRYPKAMEMWKLLNSDAEVHACWDMADYITVAKLGFNDHGEVHAKIVAANALKILDLLLESNVIPDIMKEKAGDEDDAHLIVMSGGLLHDIGNQVHRLNHNVSGVYIAISILNRLLPKVYDDQEIMYEIRGHILHTIYAHEFTIPDITIEAAIVGISDGTDMTKGRGRLAYDTGNVNIHTVSALSIESVEITKGEMKPVQIRIIMSNSAGVFQIQETLGKKIEHSNLKDYVEVVAEAHPEGAEKDARIIQRLIFKEGKFIAY